MEPGDGKVVIKPTVELLEAAIGLRNDPRWQVILQGLKAERELRVHELLAAEQSSEYQRAIIVGRVRAIQDFVSFAETAQETLRTFGTR